jgi:hypothetical protein
MNYNIILISVLRKKGGGHYKSIKVKELYKRYQV